MGRLTQMPRKLKKRIKKNLAYAAKVMNELVEELEKNEKHEPDKPENGTNARPEYK
jgi:hypothetical protein